MGSIKPYGIVIVIMLAAASLLYAGSAEDNPVVDLLAKGPFIQNCVYVNQELGFCIEGPKGWSGATQGVDQEGKPLYSFPPGVRAAYIKYYGAEEKQHLFNPSFFVSIFSKGAYSSALDALNSYVKGPGIELLTPPTVQKMGEIEWAISVLKIPTSVAGKPRNHIKKIYLCVRKESFILIEVFDTEQEYVQDERVFDEAVIRAKFSEDAWDLIKARINEAGKKK